MIDAHSHPESVALDSWSITLPWTYDVEELLTFVQEYCEEHPEIPYFYGRYYPSDLFGAEGPTAALLDEYVSDRPVKLQDFSDHCSWFNSKAMELMGIDKDTPDPAGTAEIVRDAKGNPTGWFKEGSSYSPYIGNMYEAIDWYPPKTLDFDMWSSVIDFYHSQGVIGMGDAILESEDNLKAIYDMDQAGELNMYYSVMIRVNGYKGLENAINKVKEYQQKYTTENITIDTIKYFVDGTNEIGTSYVVEPFSNDPDHENCGSLDMTLEELTDMMIRLNEEGIDLHMHVVGDGGFRVICDATEAAQNECGNDWRIQIEMTHCELIHPEDETRPAELGIIVNWSPHWTGGYFGEAAIEWLGEARFNSMYNFQPMIEAGAIVNMGSDTVSQYEFHRASPFFGMQTAITRVDPEFPMDAEQYPGSVRPEASAAFTMDQMIKGYTINSAIQFRIDNIAGSIEKGKNADFCVIKENLYNADPFKLSEIEPSAVVFKGNVISGGF
jgi:predicted amidohydrolase YtcJ